MSRFVAFLRAINVGGRRATREDLVGAFDSAGFPGAQTFLASGNVVFDAPEGDERAVVAAVEPALEAGLGFPIPVFLRSAAEVRAITAVEPFDESAIEGFDGRLQVAVLHDAPSPGRTQKIRALATERDLVAVDGREVYWLPSGGISGSTIDMAMLEDAAGPMTMRTMNTMERIAAKFLEPADE